MASMANIFKLAKELNLEGDQLTAFIKEAKEELIRKEELEREDKLRKEELEREEKRRKEDIEREERRLEREDKCREREKEIEIERIKAEAKKEKSESAGKSNDKNDPYTSKIPRMTPFCENKGDTMDAFIHRFEIQAKTYKWSEDSKFMALSNLLSGESLKVLQTLGDNHQNYKSLKEALLKRFQCTEDGFQSRFHNAIPESQEDINTFISRLELLFDRWLEMAGITVGDFDKLRDLVIRDQIYNSLNIDMVTFLKERSPKSISEIRDISNKFVSAYPQKPLAKETNLTACFSSTNKDRHVQFKHEDRPRFNYNENSRFSGYKSVA